ncbi:MAG TPA: tRNA (N6-threonylcarbamoyladenosine(37)-N6)-methyltransferase TrmO [Dehalococcoidia bacterium]|nr:tRNA (N6-threonylcarbamoyladenosine(37)-N6)-methyltransferase TrmO [Dehalococcoidia bacterium]
MPDPEITLEPIGIVRNGIAQPLKGGWREIVSEITIEERWVEALEGIEGFSHIIVLFWMHQLPPEQRGATKTHPQGRHDLPLMGVFATRSPCRPNPLGLAVVRLLERRGKLLRVKGLDALDGSPVLDIKPYTPGDRIARPGVPPWFKKLWAELQQGQP